MLMTYENKLQISKDTVKVITPTQVKLYQTVFKGELKEHGAYDVV